jgi:drug/metabolite transporter superfamily protein YnfA
MDLMTLLWLLAAALLEAGGDALVRAGIRSAGIARLVLWLAGALAVFAYGFAVNTPKWNFGRLLGVYVTLFFLVAQLIGWCFFHEVPGRGILLGGACILAGGAIMTLLQ